MLLWHNVNMWVDICRLEGIMVKLNFDIFFLKTLIAVRSGGTPTAGIPFSRRRSSNKGGQAATPTASGLSVGSNRLYVYSGMGECLYIPVFKA